MRYLWGGSACCQPLWSWISGNLNVCFPFIRNRKLVHCGIVLLTTCLSPQPAGSEVGSWWLGGLRNSLNWSIRGLGSIEAWSRTGLPHRWYKITQTSNCESVGAATPVTQRLRAPLTTENHRCCFFFDDIGFLSLAAHENHLTAQASFQKEIWGWPQASHFLDAASPFWCTTWAGDCVLGDLALRTPCTLRKEHEWVMRLWEPYKHGAVSRPSLQVCWRHCEAARWERNESMLSRVGQPSAGLPPGAATWSWKRKQPV